MTRAQPTPSQKQGLALAQSVDPVSGLEHLVSLCPAQEWALVYISISHKSRKKFFSISKNLFLFKLLFLELA
jgi:hypothetical protein